MDIKMFNPVNTVDADDDYELMVKEGENYDLSELEQQKMDEWLDKLFVQYQQEEMYRVV